MNDDRLTALIEAYAGAPDAPDRERWRQLLDGDPAAPVVVTNLFRVRERADRDRLDGEDLSGFEAMLRYSAVSERKVAEVGGRFAARALGQVTLIGPDGPWNLVAVAEYPSRDALVTLFCDPEYQAAFRYRSAAVESQQVLLGAPV